MPTPEDAFGFRIDDQLGQAVRTIEGQRAAGSGPRKFRDFDLDALRLRLRFGQAAPGHFRIGENNGGDDDFRKRAVLADDDFDGDARFLGALCASKMPPAMSPMA